MLRRPTPNRQRGIDPRWRTAAAVIMVLVTVGCGLTDAATPDTSVPVPVARPRRILSAAEASTWHSLGEPGVGGRVNTVWMDPTNGAHLVAGGDMLSIAYTFDGGDNWSRSSGLLSYEVNRLTSGSSSTTIWAATMSGPALSIDGGRTFVAKRSGMPSLASDHYSAPVDTILIDPSNPSHVVAFGGSHRDWESPSPATLWGAVWASVDAGEHWFRITDVVNGGNVVSAAWTGDGAMLAAVRHQGLFSSRDQGRSWQRIPVPSDDIGEVEANPRDAASWWIATATTPASGEHSSLAPGTPEPGTVFATSDAGTTWTRRDRGLSHAGSTSDDERSQYLSLAAAPSDPRILYTGDNGWNSGRLFRSDDAGATWRTVLDSDSGPARFYPSGVSAREFAIDATDPGHVVVACDEFVLETLDGGRHWADLTSSLTGPQRWSGHGFSGLVANGTSFNPFTRDELALSGFDGANPLTSTDGGLSWDRPLGPTARWGGAYDTSYGSADSMFVLLGQAGSFDGVARSTDGGRRWTIAGGPANGLPELSPAYSSPDSPGSVFAVDANVVLVTIGGNLYRSTDGAKHFELVDAGHGLSAIGSRPGRRDQPFVRGKNAVFVSFDSGAHIGALADSPPTKGDLAALAAGPDERSDLFVTVRGRRGANGVWRLSNSKWSKVLGNDSVSDVAVDPSAPRRVVASTTDDPFHDVMRSSGVWLSEDSGNSWRQYNEGLAMSRVATVEFDPFHPGRMVAGTVGAGYFEADLGPARSR